VDAIADANKADAALNNLDDVRGIRGRPAELYDRQPLPALNPGRATHHAAEHVGDCFGTMNLEKRRTRIQATETSASKIKLFQKATIAVITPDRRAG
jgi:hypothetical protein